MFKKKRDIKRLIIQNEAEIKHRIKKDRIDKQYIYGKPDKLETNVVHSEENEENFNFANFNNGLVISARNYVIYYRA